MLPVDVIAAVLYYTLTRDHMEPRAAGGGLWAWMALSIVAGWAVTLLATQLAVRSLSRQAAPPVELRSKIAWICGGIRGACLVLYLFQLNVIGWPGTAVQDMRSWSLCLDALVGLAPFVILLTGAWLPMRPLERLLDPRPWTTWGYARFRFQYTFFIMIPWLCLWAVMDAVRWGMGGSSVEWLASEGATTVATLIGAVLVAVAYPAVLVRFWRCRRLPDGPLRTALEELQRKAGARFSDFLIWPLGSGMLINAAALGYVRPFRYMLLSEGLLERLTGPELMAVAAHELGHVRHRHLVWYLMLTMAFMAFFVRLSEWTLSVHVQAVVLCLLFAVYLRVVFGFISRRFERQADLFSVLMMDGADPLACGLEKIAFFTGHPRTARCWHHRSIDERIRFIREAEREPTIRRRHDHDVGVIKRIILLSCAALVLATASDFLGDRPAGTGAWRSAGRDARAEEGRYRRVLELIPGDAEASEALAAMALSGQLSASPTEIEGWIADAISHAPDPLRRARAEALRARLAASVAEERRPDSDIHP